MTEKELNEEYIRNKLMYCKSKEEEIHIINEMLQKRYIMGLEQGKFDKQVELEEEKNALMEALFLARSKYKNDKARYRRKYRQKRDNWKKLEEFIINKINELEEDNADDEELRGYLIQRRDDFKYILNKMQEIRGDENDTSKSA